MRACGCLSPRSRSDPQIPRLCNCLCVASCDSALWKYYGFCSSPALPPFLFGPLNWPPPLFISFSQLDLPAPATLLGLRHVPPLQVTTPATPVPCAVLPRCLGEWELLGRERGCVGWACLAQVTAPPHISFSLHFPSAHRKFLCSLQVQGWFLTMLKEGIKIQGVSSVSRKGA